MIGSNLRQQRSLHANTWCKSALSSLNNEWFHQKLENNGYFVKIGDVRESSSGNRLIIHNCAGTYIKCSCDFNQKIFIDSRKNILYYLHPKAEKYCIGCDAFLSICTAIKTCPRCSYPLIKKESCNLCKVHQKINISYCRKCYELMYIISKGEAAPWLDYITEYTNGMLYPLLCEAKNCKENAADDSTYCKYHNLMIKSGKDESSFAYDVLCDLHKRRRVSSK
jgi:hypothetical protein